MNEANQAGLSVLLVEDEPLIAMMLEDFVDGLGHRVAGMADSVMDALSAVEQTDFDVAILDVHLRGGEACWPVADALRDAGKPFILATGGHVEPPPERHKGCPTVTKPYTMEAIREGLTNSTASSPK